MHIDMAMGIDWPAMIDWASRHPTINIVLFVAYATLLPQIALLTPRTQKVTFNLTV
jgi:hypothetical protein